MKTLMIIALFAFSAFAEDPKIIPEVRTTSGTLLLTNAQFSSVIGRRVTFKTEKGPKAFDVLEISTTNLTELGINPTEAVAKQEAIDAAKQRYQQDYKKAAVVGASREAEQWDKIKQNQADAEKERKKQAVIAQEKAKQAERDALAREAVESEIRVNNARANALNRIP